MNQNPAQMRSVREGEPMLISISKAEFDTILAALRLYQREGFWLPHIACPTADDTSLDADGIDQLCERINTSGDPFKEALAAAHDHMVMKDGGPAGIPHSRAFTLVKNALDAVDKMDNE
jgi:hypothetical protein